MASRRFLSLVNRHRLKHVLRYMLDENEFLSPYGIRALSRLSPRAPVYVTGRTAWNIGSTTSPAESSTGLFGGNSNWRGPIWFPVNYLLIESLQKFHYYLGDNYKVECPTGSGKMQEPLGSRRPNFPAPHAAYFCATNRAAGRSSAARKNSKKIPTGAI